jgi:hypothetical protein
MKTIKSSETNNRWPPRKFMTASSDANGTENLDQVSQISSGDEPAT